MTEITYTEVNGYLIPNLTAPQTEAQIGKYGQMRRKFLKNHRPSLYTSLMITGKITEHLLEVQTSATEQIQKIVRKLAQTEGVNEELKAKDPMMWTGLMNNLLHSAEEVVLPEVVYS
ncbi:TnpV protein [Oscillospiraceae bacterium NSJ-50]|uniref:TnpV protein n=1 Tax=Qingrenia yutianensis TaxID=2763676 RepID=A0A926FA49_9FIRM|nr:TnpV protein [Qingrenia yutianensis]MBC8597536.1 TnpV protein [Qingrenia yutianensis]